MAVRLGTSFAPSEQMQHRQHKTHPSKTDVEPLQVSPDRCSQPRERRKPQVGGFHFNLQIEIARAWANWTATFDFFLGGRGGEGKKMRHIRFITLPRSQKI